VDVYGLFVASKKTLSYRNRAQLKTDGKNLGFVANGTTKLVSVDDCLILTDKNRETLAHLRGTLPQPAWKPRSRQKWTSIDIDESCDADSASINQRLPFRQANDGQNQAMQQWLLESARQLKRSVKVLELFAGSGNFTRILAELGFREIVAVEVVEEAIGALKLQQLTGVKAESCDLFQEQAFTNLIEQHQDARVLVLDPPRDGLKVKPALFSKKMQLQDVFYISCDLATLTRDLKEFVDHGYKLQSVQPLDLLPHSAHVEILVWLSRKGQC